MNKKNGQKKLLAAVAVMAMVMCAFAFVTPADDIDGAGSSTLEYTISEENGVTYLSGPSNGTGDATKIEFSGGVLLTTAEAANKNVKVTMNSGTLTSNMTILVYSGTGVANTGNVTFIMNGGQAEGVRMCSNIAGQFLTDYGSTTVYGTPMTDSTVDAYAKMVNSADAVNVNINGGVIKDIQTTFSFAKVSSYSIDVSAGTVDRIVLGGSNGNIGATSVSISGGHVGYITSMRAVMSSLTYNITGGTIDYLTIGADVEGAKNTSGTSMQTASVAGDVIVNIASNVTIKNPVIIGGGILDLPATPAYDGAVASAYTIGTDDVIINTPGRTIQLSESHYTADGESVKILWDYEIGDASSITTVLMTATKDSSDVDYVSGGMTIYWGGENTFGTTGKASKDLYVKAGSVFLPENAVYFGKVYTDSAKANYATLSDIKAGADGITISVGSIYISGDFKEGSDGSITLSGDAEISGDVGTGVAVLGTVIVPQGTTLTISGAGVELGNVTVNGSLVIEDGAIVTSGNMTRVTINEGAIMSVAEDASGLEIENNGTIAITKEDAKLPSSIDGTGSVDTSAVASEGTISGDWKTTTKYTANQTITLTGPTTLMKGTQIVIEGKLIIPEGVTLTIEDGAQLVFYSSTALLENDGTIVVLSNAGRISAPGQLSGIDDTTGGLVVYYAKAVNNGTIELEYSPESGTGIGTSTQLNICLSDFTNNGEIIVGTESIFLVNGSFINTEDAKATINGYFWQNSGTIGNAGTISINGSLYSNGGSPTVTIELTNENATVEVISVTGGTLDVTNDIEKEGSTTIEYVGDLGASKISIISTANYAIKGLTITPVFIENVNDGKDKVTTYDRFVTIEGSASYTWVGDTAETPNSLAGTISMTKNVIVSGDLTIGSGIAMTIIADSNVIVSGNLTFVGNTNISSDEILNNAAITVTGKIVSNKPIVAGIAVNVPVVIDGAYYVIDATVTTAASYVYTSLATAVADGAKKITVTGKNTVDVDIAVPADVSISIDASALVVILDDVEVSFADGSVLRNAVTAGTGTVTGGKLDKGIQVLGSLYLEDWKAILKSAGEIVSDVIIQGEKDRTYTNLTTALNVAEKGDVVKLSYGIIIRGTVVIPEGITLDTDGKNVNVENDSILQVDGVFFINKNSAVALALRDTVNDKEAGKIELNGTVKSTSQIPADLNIAGAYYSILEGAQTYFYVEPVAIAAPKIATVQNMTMEIVGKNTIPDVTFTGTTDQAAIVKVSGEIEGGIIILDLATIEFGAVKFKGTIANGVGSVALDGTASNDLKVSSTTRSDVKALTVTGAFTATVKDSKLVGKFIITGDVSANKLTVNYVTVDGTLKVVGTEKTKITEILTVNGTLLVDNGAQAEAKIAEILGTLTAAEKNDKGEGKFTADIMYVGVTQKDAFKVYTVAAAATASGNVKASGYAFVAAGATVPESITGSTGSPSKKTEFYLEDELYMTVYVFTPATTLYLGNVVAQVEDARFDGWVDDKYVSVMNTPIGDVEKATAMITYNIYVITLVANEGIADVSIDGNLMEYGMFGDSKNGWTYGYTATVSAGTHKIDYTLKNGYSGTAILTVNGKAVTGLDFTTEGTPAEGMDVIPYQLQLSGIEKSGYTADSSDSGDSGMGITDYLLIVLVILVVILAALVAMRMMRS